MDFNLGLCKPSQTEVFYWGRGGSQVFLSVRDEWPASLLYTEGLCLLHPARSCSHDMGDGSAFSDTADASILSVALSSVCGSVKC